MKNNRKGFTLIELLVVVLILGILAAMAMPQYFKAVERSRMSEAVSLLSSIASAQQRKYLQINSYASNYKGLDVAPEGATGADYFTKGGNDTTPGNGFKISLSGTSYGAGKATAVRVGPNALTYKYTLQRFYNSDKIMCQGDDENGAALCADFCGKDSMAVDTCCTNAGGDCTLDTNPDTVTPQP